MADQSLLQTIYNPTAQADQMAIAQRQKYADLLRQQSFTPDQGQMVSGHYVAPSWTQHLAKLLGAWKAGEIDKQNQTDSAEINKRTAEALRAAAPDFLPSNQPTQAQPTQSVPDTPPVGGSPNPQALAQAMLSGSNSSQLPIDQSPQAVPQPSSAPAQPSQGAPNPFGFSNLMRSQVAGAVGGEPAAAAFWRRTAPDPTDIEKLLIAQGIDPRSSQGQQAIHDAMTKANYIAPVAVRQGSTILDPRTNQPTFTAPDMDSGAMLQWKNGQPSGVQIPGMAQIQGNLEAAKARGRGRYQFAPQTYGPDNQPLPAQTITEAVDGGPSSDQAAIAAWKAQGSPDGFTAIPNGQGGVNVTSAPRGTLVPQLGAQQGAQDRQVGMTKSWDQLQESGRSAQTVSSWMQNINDLAGKAATGAASDKINLVNGLLSLVGNEKATDARTANDLLAKYSNQITAKLGGGANGTDASRAIIQAAFPNSHMTKDAIAEAVSNLTGANDMTLAKRNLLAPHANASDPVGYQKKEQVFDQNADPRIWQLKAMKAQNPQAAAVFVQKVMKQDPHFLERLKALEGIGAL